MIHLTLVCAGNGGPEPTWSLPGCVSFLFLTSLRSLSARPSPDRARRACRTAASAAGRRRGRAAITSARSMTSRAPRPGRPSSGPLRGAKASRRPIPQYPDTTAHAGSMV
jgi:hypothetical protein